MNDASASRFNQGDFGDFGHTQSPLPFPPPPQPQPQPQAAAKSGLVARLDAAYRVLRAIIAPAGDANTRGPVDPRDPRNHQILMQAWHYQHSRQEHTAKRLALLNPNEHSDVKVEAYVFSLNPLQFATTPTLIWGTANGWTAFKNPQVPFRAERMFVNVEWAGVAYLENIQAANVNAQIGSTADAFSFSPLAVGTKLSLPTLPPQNTMQVQGTWTTRVPTSVERTVEWKRRIQRDEERAELSAKADSLRRSIEAGVRNKKVLAELESVRKRLSQLPSLGKSFLMAIDFQGWATVIA
jgi:hypothetical protein